MTWQESELIEAWDWAAPLVPAPYELTGVTFHKGHELAPWVAFAYSDELAKFGPEGVGSTPIEALYDLVRAFRSQAELDRPEPNEP